MALTDYKTAVYNQVWTLLEAETEVTSRVTSGNRIKLTQQAGWLKDVFSGRASTDFPQIKVGVGRFANTAYAETPTLAMNATTFASGSSPAWKIQRTAEFLITVTSDTRKIGDADTLEEAVQMALVKGGPKLGLTYVIGWSLSGNQEMTDRSEARGTYRLVTKLLLTVTMRFDGSTFL